MKNLSVLKRARSLGQLSSKWLDRNYFFRKLAVTRLVARSDYSKKMAEALIDSIFSELTFPKLRTMLSAEIGNPRYLDGFQKDRLTGTLRRAQAPQHITHVFSANVPNPAIVSFVLGLLLGSKNTGKLSRRDAGFLDIYLRSLKMHDASLAKGQSLTSQSDTASLKRLFSKSQVIAAYGSNETLAELKKIAPPEAVFSGYGHRVSFGMLLKEALLPKSLGALARAYAKDIWMLDQRGCLSPTAIYVETGGAVSVESFARALHLALKREKDKKWTLIYQAKWKGLPLNSGTRMIFIRPLQNVKHLYRELAPFSKYLQCVALEASSTRRLVIGESLSKLGVNRITRAGRMQFPPITWPHDGRPNIADWLRWTSLE